MLAIDNTSITQPGFWLKKWFIDGVERAIFIITYHWVKHHKNRKRH